MIAETIGARIKRLRYSFTPRITQAVLGDYCGVSRAAVNQWEVDRTTPSGPSLIAAARLLGVSPEYLLEGKEQPTEEPRVQETILVQAVLDALNYMDSTRTSIDDKPKKFAEVVAMQYLIRVREKADS